MGDFEIILIGLYQTHLKSGMFGNGGVVGQVQTNGPAMGVQDRRKPKPLRCLRAPQSVARYPPDDIRPLRHFYGVRHRDGGDGAVSLRQRGNDHAINGVRYR